MPDRYCAGDGGRFDWFATVAQFPIVQRVHHLLVQKMALSLERCFPEIVKSMAFLDDDPAKHFATQYSRANSDVASSQATIP